MSMVTNLTGSTNKICQLGLNPFLTNLSLEAANIAVSGDFWEHLCTGIYSTHLATNDAVTVDSFLVIGTEPGVQVSDVIVTVPYGGLVLTSQAGIGADVTLAQWLAATTADGIAGFVTGTSNWTAAIADLRDGFSVSGIPQIFTYNNVLDQGSLTGLHLPTTILNTAGVLSDVTLSISTGETPIFVSGSTSGTLDINLIMDVDTAQYSGVIKDAVSMVLTKVLCNYSSLGSVLEIQHDTMTIL